MLERKNGFDTNFEFTSIELKTLSKKASAHKNTPYN